MRRPSLSILLVFLGLFAFPSLIFLQFNKCNVPFAPARESPNIAPSYALDNSSERRPSYDRNLPLIFIGGVPRSGTTLMRAMLDAHPDVRCGEETRVIPRLLSMRTQWEKSQREAKRLEEAGLTGDVLNYAISAFILEVIVRHGEPAPRLCNKDPFTLKSTKLLAQMFPNAKYLLMIRDGRASVHSMITRKVTISGFDLNNYRQCLTKWNQAIENMYNQCVAVGESKCMPVFYEKLVLQPSAYVRKILDFLDVPFNESVLHHQDFINKPGGISLSKVERSTDQVIKPVNLEALSKWVGKIPKEVVADMDKVAPMLRKLGYDPFGNPPKYGEPEKVVRENTNDIEKNHYFWENKAQEVKGFSPPGRKLRGLSEENKLRVGVGESVVGGGGSGFDGGGGVAGGGHGSRGEEENTDTGADKRRVIGYPDGVR